MTIGDLIAKLQTYDATIPVKIFYPLVAGPPDYLAEVHVEFNGQQLVIEPDREHTLNGMVDQR